MKILTRYIIYIGDKSVGRPVHTVGRRSLQEDGPITFFRTEKYIWPPIYVYEICIYI